ncbi:MAG: DNA repair protein RecN [Porticoccaceae bacterium]
MLTSLSIRNFALAESLDVDFHGGMTALTGETGAGKSLVVDALGMALGDRADSERIRNGADKAEIAATFAVQTNQAAQDWLAANDYDPDDECLLRRIVTREGRSRGYINGQPATMQQLQELGERLIDIHSQHEHQSLLRRETHRRLLDDFAEVGGLGVQVADDYLRWRQTADRLAELENNADAIDARRDLLSFQIGELAQLGLAEGEIAQLEQEQRLLANIDTIRSTTQEVLALCDGGADDAPFDLASGLRRATQLLRTLADKATAVQTIESLLDSARIQVEEATGELHHYLDNLELDPSRLQWVEDRLGAAHLLARKHRMPADLLPELHRKLIEERGGLAGGESLAALAATLAELQASYLKGAKRLSTARAKAAKILGAAINEQLAKLAMAGATLAVALTPLAAGRYSSHGLETVEFLISTNPGQPPRPLAKVASGGELSRVSLAIQVVAARHSTIPSLVFDEVDVGIGGATATVVGQLLRELGGRGQAICVTHLAQVASAAHHHLVVNKIQGSDSAETELRNVQTDDRIDEIARMLGGLITSPQTLAHAREMLALATST